MKLTDEELGQINLAFSDIRVKGERYPETHQKMIDR
jgi:hypothetical protein